MPQVVQPSGHTAELTHGVLYEVDPESGHLRRSQVQRTSGASFATAQDTTSQELAQPQRGSELRGRSSEASQGGRGSQRRSMGRPSRGSQFV